MISHVNSACAYVWTYRVKPEWRERFAEAYGPNGVWRAFFMKSSGYIRTDLMRDDDDPDRFATVDYFKDSQSRTDVVAANSEEFEKIDSEWEEATIEESFIGMFVTESNS
ncbi:MAG: antibiotic biosynthesis monooxygenase [Pseudomonadota bacterium]